MFSDSIPIVVNNLESPIIERFLRAANSSINGFKQASVTFGNLFIWPVTGLSENPFLMASATFNKIGTISKNFLEQ